MKTILKFSGNNNFFHLAELAEGQFVLLSKTILTEKNLDKIIEKLKSVYQDILLRNIRKTAHPKLTY